MREDTIRADVEFAVVEFYKPDSHVTFVIFRALFWECFPAQK
jgi:hypothetical protein